MLNRKEEPVGRFEKEREVLCQSLAAVLLFSLNGFESL